MQCQPGHGGPPMSQQMTAQQPIQMGPVPFEGGSQMCIPQQQPMQMQRGPHQMQPPLPSVTGGPQQANFDQKMSMLLERQETIKAVMNDPANQHQFQQLQTQLAQNTQEIKGLKQRQSMFYQQQSNFATPGGPPGGPIMNAHPGSNTFVEMNAPHAFQHPAVQVGPPGPAMQPGMINKSQSVTAWQHQNYMIDSGINSGHSTAPPSLCSNGTGNELLDNDDVDSVYSSHASWSGSTPGYPQACYTPEQYDSFSGTTRGVGMYYDNGPNSIPCETPSYPSPQQYDPNNQAPPNMVVQPGPSQSVTPQGMQPQQGQQAPQQQMPRQSLKEAISQIAQMLDDNDMVVQLQAAETAQAMAKNAANRPAIIQSPQMIQSLVNALNSSNEDIVRCTAGTLHDLSQMKPGLLSIFKCGGIQTLIGLLQSPREAILFYAITTLHNLLLHQDGAKSAVALANGIPILVRLLQRHSNVKFLAITVDCLRSLAYGNPNNKEEILKADGPALLVKALTTYEYEKLLWTISRVLKVLSVCPNNKQAIVAANGVHALAYHLNKPGNPSSRLIQNCLWTLRNISDVTTQNANMTDLLQKLIPYVKCNDPLMSSCAVCILSNLLCNNVHNKMAFVQMQGIQALLFAIENTRQAEDLIEPALCALRHATSRHQMMAQAQAVIRSGPGLHCVMMLMDQHISAGSGASSASTSSGGGSGGGSKWPVLKAAVGLLRNMCTSTVNLPDLLQCGSVARLVAVIKSAQTDWQRRAAAGQEYRLDGVKMEDIVEGAIGALHLIASKGQTESALYRNAIKSTPNAINIFVQMLASNSKTVLRVTCSLLSELAIDPDGAEMIRHTSNLQPLGGLMENSDSHISEASNLLFQRLTPQESKATFSGHSASTGVHPGSHGGPPPLYTPGQQPPTQMTPQMLQQPGSQQRTMMESSAHITPATQSQMQQGPMSVEPGAADVLSDVHAFQPMDVQSSLAGAAGGGGQGQSFSAGSSFSNFGGSQSNISSSMFGNHPINSDFALPGSMELGNLGSIEDFDFDF